MMKRRIFTFFFCFLALAGYTDYLAQEVPSIRVRKESDLSKVVFDNTEYKLIVVDRFGNPRDNRIASYRLYVKGRNVTQEFAGYGNNLTREMIACLNKVSGATKIFFTEINVKDDDEHLVKLPDVIDVWFPDCANCDKGKKRR